MSIFDSRNEIEMKLIESRVKFEYSMTEGFIEETITFDNKVFSAKRVQPNGSANEFSDPASEWWRSHLQGNKTVPTKKGNRISFVDFFAASGGLSLGFTEAASNLGYKTNCLFAADMDKRALEVYSHNFKPLFTSSDSVAELVDFHLVNEEHEIAFDGNPIIVNSDLKSLVGKVDVVLAGPPCQGHSSLNNALRHNDPRNRFYIYPAIIGIALGARAVLIENVPGVNRDLGSIAERTESLLNSNGYSTIGIKIKAEELGWPQTRHRYFLIAVKNGDSSIVSDVIDAMKLPTRPISWALNDLLKKKVADVLDESPVLSAENQQRIQWLFDNDADNLPDSERPDCHKDKPHSYPSVYGRMRWDRPSGTLTTGFLSPGRGRYVHPKFPRTLTPREAARLQGFPDNYYSSMSSSQGFGRTQLAKWIGDAVPIPLGFAASLSMLLQMEE